MIMKGLGFLCYLIGIFLILSMIVSINASSEREECKPLIKGIVVDKTTDFFLGRILIVKDKDNKIHRQFVYGIDYNSYMVGDTIK